MKTVEEVEAFRKLWMDSLRGGEFLQATGVLEGDGMYDHTGSEISEGEADEFPVGNCCMGVGLKIDPEADLGMVDSDNEEMPSPEWLAKWGISAEDADKLASMNDGSDGRSRHSFDEISDHIGTIDMVPYIPTRF